MAAPSALFDDEDLELLEGARQFAEIEASVRQIQAATVGVTTEEVISAAAEADAFVVHCARENANIFCEYVLRDEQTGKPHGLQAAHHVEWHRLAGEHDRLILWAFPEAGKTLQFSIGRTLWLLGRNPNLRLAIVSETHSLAKKIVKAISKYIETSEELRRVFPGLRPGKEAPWTETSLFVERSTHAKDPSVRAYGLHGQLWGSRIDGLILDDILSPDNTRTKVARDACWQWYGDIQGRLTEDAFVLAIGNAFHPDDVLHRLAKQERWVWRRFPVLNQDGTSSWPDRWSLERIGKKRRDMAGTPTEFARQFLCQARSDEDARFKQAWIDLCLARGNGRTMQSEADYARGVLDQMAFGAGGRVYTGVDLAVQKHEAADLTVFFTVRAHGNGDREIVDVTSGRMGAPEILAKMREIYQRYGSIFIVENNACFVPGTRVLTRERGYVSIEDVKVGEHTWTHKGRWRPITGRVVGKSRRMTPVKVTGSLPLMGTPNHWFWLRHARRTPGRAGGHTRPESAFAQWASIGFVDGPVYAATAVPSWPRRRAILNVPKTARSPARAISVDEALAVWLGLYMAEGSSTRRQVMLTLGKGEGDIAEWAAFVTRALFPDRVISVVAHGSTIRVTVNSTALATMLRAAVGKSRAKCLPLAWLGWPLEVRTAIVRGWLLGDGCLRANGKHSRVLSGQTISRNWGMWARTTLFDAGMRPTIAPIKAKASQIAGRTLNGGPAFLVGLNPEDTSVLLSMATLAIERRRWRAGPKVGKQAPRSCIQTILRDPHAWSKVRTGPGLWEQYGDGDVGDVVYNLEVAEDESFTAEDTIVHNAQAYIVQMMASSTAIPVKGFTTGRNKAHPEFGIESLSNEMANAKWIIPNHEGVMHPDIRAWVDEMLYYDPRGHTGDRLMASWFAREGIRMGEVPTPTAETGRVNW